MLYAYPDIARFGLGNKLVVWSRAEVFAREHGGVVLKPCFTQLPSVGALLRCEGFGRMNLGCFDLSAGGFVSGRERSRVLQHLPVVDESDWIEGQTDVAVRFAGLGDDSFAQMLRHHDYVVGRLRSITNKQILKKVEMLADRPFIGVHVRRGDFKAVGIMTDDEWYVRAVQTALRVWHDQACGHGEPLIRVFSDGRADELQFLVRAFPEVRVIIMPKAKPLQDIWSLSKSRVLVGSSGSSFSIWAVLLGQMPSIWAPVRAPLARELYVNASTEPIVVE